MAQLSIFEKQRHFSDKDLTISVGKYETIYITFRHSSWKRFTCSDYIAVAIKDGVLVFGDPDDCINWKSFKLKKTKGNPETFEYTRYLQISGKAWPELLNAARNMLGSFNFDEVDKNDEKELEASEEPELIVPKGFVVLSKGVFDSIMIRVEDIRLVDERFGDCFVVTKEYGEIKTLNSFDEIVALINNALEV